MFRMLVTDVVSEHIPLAPLTESYIVRLTDVNDFSPSSVTDGYTPGQNVHNW